MGSDSHLKKLDVDALSALHRETLPASLLTMLGQPVIDAYYQFIQASANEFLFSIREDGRLVGGCVVSLKPGSLNRRFFTNQCLRLIPHLLGALFSGRLRFGLIKTLLTGHAGPTNLLTLPEIVQIFTAADFRKKHVGQRLVEKAEQFLKKKNISRYYLKTIAQPNNAAMIFYEKLHFRKATEGTYGNQPFIFLTKDI